MTEGVLRLLQHLKPCTTWRILQPQGLSSLPFKTLEALFESKNRTKGRFSSLFSSLSAFFRRVLASAGTISLCYLCSLVVSPLLVKLALAMAEDVLRPFPSRQPTVNHIVYFQPLLPYGTMAESHRMIVLNISTSLRE
tara:strand:- start:109 stop:522 length:414 start_codon:yes stop_codon:yes gene_type:complete